MTVEEACKAIIYIKNKIKKASRINYLLVFLWFFTLQPKIKIKNKRELTNKGN